MKIEDNTPSGPVFSAALEFLNQHGFTEPVPLDGKLRRYVHNCGPGKAAWAVFSTSVVPHGTVGCHRCGIKARWFGIDRELTEEEAKAIAKAEVANRKLEKERQEAISESLTEIITRELEFAPDDHPYLVKKGIKANGAKIRLGILILPLQTSDGRIWSAQGISGSPVPAWGDRTKSFEAGGRITGCFYPIGTIKGAGRVLICEGFATGATLHEATRLPTVCAMSAGNLMETAKAIRSLSPTATITICADSDRHTEGNPGMAAANAASMAVNAAFVAPDFTGYPDDRDHTDFNDMVRVLGIGGFDTVRNLVMKQVPPAMPICLYDAGTQGWWSLDGATKRFLQVREGTVRNHLHIGGVSRTAKGDSPTPLDLEIDRLIHYDFVDYAGPIAGWPKGLYSQGGRRVLVTGDCPMPLKGGGGDFPILEKLLLNGLGEWQYTILMMSCHLARRRILTQHWHPLPALALVGARNSGKSFTQRIITLLLGGRAEKPHLFMTGGTPFNGHLFGSEHLMLEDETGKTDAISRRHLGEAIKTMLFARTVSCHSKGRPAISLEPYWFLTLSINSDPEHLLALPPVDASLKDKLTILKFDHVDRNVPEGRDETEWLESVLAVEMPALIATLDAMQPNKLHPSLRDSRTILKAWQHPEIMEQVSALAPEAQFLAILNDVLFVEGRDHGAPTTPQPWSGTAEALTRKLRDSSYGRQVDKLLSWPTACGVYLSRGMREHPDRIQQSRDMKKRFWTIGPEPSQDVEP